MQDLQGAEDETDIGSDCLFRPVAWHRTCFSHAGSKILILQLHVHRCLRCAWWIFNNVIFRTLPEARISETNSLLLSSANHELIFYKITMRSEY